MADQIEHGEHGLYYLTDPSERGVFIAAPSEPLAIARAMEARVALRSGLNITDHVMHDHMHGGRMTVPVPDEMTVAQRQETIDRLQAHVRAHFVS